ncbi:MAG: hypothetical protein ACREMY_21435, partial [bacterium]
REAAAQEVMPGCYAPDGVMVPERERVTCARRLSRRTRGATCGVVARTPMARKSSQGRARAQGFAVDVR